MASTPPLSFQFVSDREPEAQSFLLELGRFVVAFERVCEQMRYAIVAILQTEGLANHGICRVVIGEKASAELQVLLGAIFSELRGRTDANDQRAVHNLLVQIKELAEERNRLVHSAWRVEPTETGSATFAAALRPRTKQKKGAPMELHRMPVPYVESLTERATKAAADLRRLRDCIEHPERKVSKELAAAT